MEKYVIDGGPHTGKTTSLESLAKRGYEIVDENARIIIKQEKANHIKNTLRSIGKSKIKLSQKDFDLQLA